MKLTLKTTLIASSVIAFLTLTGCKKEWEEKVMSKQWYKDHPEETNKLSEDCLKSGEETLVCAAVRDVKFREQQKNIKPFDFSKMNLK